MSRESHWLRTTLPIVAITAVAAIFLAPALFSGKVIWTANKANWNPWMELAPPNPYSNPGFSPDFCLSYYPRRVVLTEAWERKELPLWNPYSFCGTPFLADLQAGVLYPINWLLLGLDPIRQFPPFLLFHLVWGAAGLFLFVRSLGVPRLIAWGSGMAFVLNEYFVKNLGLPTFAATASWIPWILLGAELLVSKPNARRIAFLALIWCFTFLAGQPQTAVHATYATAIYLGFRLFARRAESEAAGVGRVVAAFAVAAALSLLLCAAQLIPTADLASRSARANLSYSTILSGSFHPVEFLRMLVPDFLGSGVEGDSWTSYFPRGNNYFKRISFSALSAGTPVFLLALWGIVAKGSRRRALPFTILLLFFAGLAFGTPLAKLAYHYLPGFKFSRIDRAGYFLILAQAILAAIAAADLAVRAGKGRKVFGLLIILVFGGAVLLVDRFAPYMAYHLGSLRAAAPPDALSIDQYLGIIARTRTAAMFAGATAIAFLLPPRRWLAIIPLLLATVQLFQFGEGYLGMKNPAAVYGETAGIRQLREHLDRGDQGGGRFIRFNRNVGGFYRFSSVIPPSTNIPFRLRDVQGYNALSESTVGEALEKCFGENVYSSGIWSGKRIVAPEDISSMNHPVLDLLSVRAAVTALPSSRGGFRVIAGPGWDTLPSEGFRLFGNSDALPRVRVIPYAIGLPEEMVREKLYSGKVEPGRAAVWVGEGVIGDSIATSGSARLLGESWNRIHIHADCESEQLLVLADTFSPGWKATVGGSETEILPVYGLIRGVRLGPGSHDVIFEYEPPYFRVGIALSLVGLIGCTVLVVKRPFRSWNNRSGRKSTVTESLDFSRRQRGA